MFFNYVFFSVGWCSAPDYVWSSVNSPCFLLESSQCLESHNGWLHSVPHQCLQTVPGFEVKKKTNSHVDDTFKPTTFNNMDHDKVYKWTVILTMIIISPVTAVPLLLKGNTC